MCHTGMRARPRQCRVDLMRLQSVPLVRLSFVWQRATVCVVKRDARQGVGEKECGSQCCIWRELCLIKITCEISHHIGVYY
jgi:hypothetical protein